jgi:arylsulfatase A-like enzyme
METTFLIEEEKVAFFEGGIRVPMVISGGYLDESYRNTKDDRLAHLVDITATMLDLAGVPIPKKLDGLSLLGSETRSVLIHNLRPTNESSMNIDDRNFFTYPIANQSNVVQYNSYKYILGNQYVDSWVDIDANPLLEVAGSLPDAQPCFPSPCLFDLSTDPYERQDISDSQPEVLEEIEAYIDSVISSEDFHSGQNYNEVLMEWKDGYIHPYL